MVSHKIIFRVRKKQLSKFMYVQWIKRKEKTDSVIYFAFEPLVESVMAFLRLQLNALFLF